MFRLLCPLDTPTVVLLVGFAFSHIAIQAQNSLPAPPKGYATVAEVMAAVGAKELKVISTPTNLPPGIVEIKDLEYGRIGERALKLDLFAPERLTRRVPALIFIHGGAWSGGKRDMYRYYTIRYAQRGYVCATISYRLSREAPFPAAVQDAKCAVRWMRANASQYNVDPDKIGVIGGSAGAHLAMMVGYSSDLPELEGSAGNPSISSRVQAVVNLYGPVDLTTEFAQKAESVRRFLDNKTYTEAKALYEKSSPLNHVSADDPPTLILHGTIDDVVPVTQADVLAHKLKEVGVAFVYDRFEGWPHAMDAIEVVNERCQLSMNQFFAKYLPLPSP
jgi:acetyl esterase/lipase